MATYIKGADTYLPDIKPFTPDYKFLSAVLDRKTDKYDSNFKATNELYNKVVYADLSRLDNKEKRDQYAETIGPAIEKISGMDLSLQQNADQAQSVFAPFYEDELIVRDVVYTSAYRKEQAMAQRLLDQGTTKAVDRYSERGVKSLQYQMDDFINADIDQAMNMKLPKYVQNVNLTTMSEKILGEMDPPLSMKMDTFSNDGKYIITNQNGAMVTGAAIRVLQQTLMQDPRVQAAYADDAFVASRDFAADGLQRGKVNTVEEGQAVWADQIISQINQRNEINIDKDLKKQKKQVQIKANWENYKAQNGIIPGSDMAIALEEQMSLTEATQAALDARMGLKREGALPTNSLDGSLNKAYRMLMQSRIEKDIVVAAMAYGARDQEQTIKVNTRSLAEYNQLMNDQRAIFNATEARRLAQDKGELINVANPLGDVIKDTRLIYGTSTTIDAATDDDGALSPNTDLIVRSNEQYITEDNKVFNEQLESSLKIMALLNPLGDDSSKDQQYSVILAPTKEFPEGKPYRGTIGELRNVLSNQVNIGPDKTTKLLGPTQRDPSEGVTGEAPSIYTQRNVVDDLFKNLATQLKDTRALTMNDPNLTMNGDTNNQYNLLYESVWGLNGTINKQAGLNQFMQTALKNHKDAYDNSSVSLLESDGGKNIYKQMADVGFPPIMTKSNSLLSLEDYQELVRKGVREGNIKNPDLGNGILSWTWDTGTSNEDYMIPAYEMVRKYDATYGKYVMKPQEVFNEDGTRAQMIDESAISNEAKRYYNGQRDKLNTFLNSGNFASGDLLATAYGRGGAKGIDALMYPTYEYMLNPLSPNPEAEAEMTQFISQLNSLDNSGKKYGIIQGDIDGTSFFGLSDDVRDMLKTDPTALKAWNLYKEDLNTWYNNPKRSNTDKIAPVSTISYMPVAGQSDVADKQYAILRINFGPEWLASKKDGSISASGVDSEFGALTLNEIKQLTGSEGFKENIGGTAGISFVIPQEFDENTKSVNNLYYSNVETAILANGGGFAEFDMPEGLSPTATYRVIKLGTNEYSLNYSINTYVPGGKYTTEQATQSINMDDGMRGLDIHIAGFNRDMQDLKKQNEKARLADGLENGNK